MDWKSIIESIGIVGIVSGLIVWLIKQLGQNYINRNFKAYEIELKTKANNYRLELDKNLESHKSELNILYNKASRLHEERLRILSKLYKKIVILDRTMQEMTAFMKQVFEDAEKEEKERIKQAGYAYDDFFTFYIENKIFFSKKLTELLDQLRDKYFDSYMDYTFRHRYSFTDFKFNHEQSKKASETVREHIPPIKEEIEIEFRDLIGVE